MENKKTVTAKYENGCLTLLVEGEIDHHSARAIREALDREIFFYRSKRVILDLSSVDFMDSSGLGLILGRYSTVSEMGGTLELSGVSAKIEKILRLAGAERLVSISRAKKEEK